MATILTDLAMRLFAQTSELKKNLSEASSRVSGFNKESKNASTQISSSFQKMQKESSNALTQMTGGLGAISPAASGALSGLKTMAGGFTTLNAALGPIGLIIGAIAIAIKALMSYFKGTTDGAEQFAKIMGFIKGILGALQDAFIALGRIIVKAFEDPKQAVADLWDAIKTNIWNRWQGLIGFFSSSFEFLKNGFQALKETIKGLFDKDAKDEAKKYWEQAKQNLVEMGDQAIQVATGLDKAQRVQIGEKLKGFMKDAISDGKEMAQIQLEQQQLEMAKIAALKKYADMDAKIADLRLKAIDKENYSNEERLKFNEEAQKLIAEEGALRVSLAQKAYDLQVRTMALTENGPEEIRKEAELYAEVVAAQKQQSDQLREITAQHVEITNTIKAEEAAQKAKDAAEAKALQDLKTKEAEYTQAIIDRNKEDKQQASYEGRIQAVKEATDAELALIKDKYDKQLVLESQYLEAKKALEETAAREIAAVELEIAQEKEDRKKEMIDAGFESAQLLTEAASSIFEAAKNRELAAAGDNEEKKEKIRKKYAKKEKGIAIIQALINTSLAFTKALSGAPPPLNFVLAAATAVAGLAQVAAISSQPLAQGGLAFGPVNALIGEYAGARSNPEVVAPLDKLQNMLGGGRVVFEIEYDKLVGVLNNGAQIKAAY